MAPTDEIGYKPQIESLRAFAVSAVLYTHFFDDFSELGHLGVRLFFVISGYLITGILLRCRTLHDDQGFQAHCFIRPFLCTSDYTHLSSVLSGAQLGLGGRSFRDSERLLVARGIRIQFPVRRAQRLGALAYGSPLELERRRTVLSGLALGDPPHAAPDARAGRRRGSRARGHVPRRLALVGAGGISVGPAASGLAEPAGAGALWRSLSGTTPFRAGCRPSGGSPEDSVLPDDHLGVPGRVLSCLV